MKHILGAVALAALACGGRGHESIAEPAEPVNQEPGGAETDSETITPPEPVEVCLDPAVWPDLRRLAFACKTCLEGAVPRCIDKIVPEPETEPPACAAPSCETPLGTAAQASIRGTVPGAGGSVLEGTCSDGKMFEATIGPFDGQITYREAGGAVVGAAAYTNMIGDCACSGESFSGDASCPNPTFETEPPEGEIRFPFADGRRAAPCLCVD